MNKCIDNFHRLRKEALLSTVHAISGSLSDPINDVLTRHYLGKARIGSNIESMFVELPLLRPVLLPVVLGIDEEGRSGQSVGISAHETERVFGMRKVIIVFRK